MQMLINTKEIATINNKKMLTNNNKIDTVTSRKIYNEENIKNENYNSFGDYTFNKSDRISAILQFLRIDYLTFERKNIVTLVKNNSDRFYIPNKHLGKTHILIHQIITTDKLPVHVKQYRFPPVHRDEITRQVN